MSEWKTIWDHEAASFGQRTMRFAGTMSTYIVKVDEGDQDDIVVSHEGADEPDTWGVFVKEEASGIVRLSGMAGGCSDGLDSPWFQLTLSSPAVLRYYGNQVLLQEHVEI